MLNMEPSIRRGLTFWDRALMPEDEFFERVRSVREEMRRLGLTALVVAGNMYEDAELIWLVGGNVDGTLVLPLEGEPVIFTNSGSREGFFLRELTWMQHLSYAGPLVGKAVAATLREKGIPAGRVGLAGLQVLASRPWHDLVDHLAGYETVDFAAAFAAIRARLRARETAAIRIALGIAGRAAEAALAAFADGAGNAAAMVEAERQARLDGAWDVRLLANLGSDGLRPFERMSAERRSPLLLWVAARYQGYWADRAVTSPEGGGTEAPAAVAAMERALRPSVTAGAVAAAGLAALPEPARAAAVAYGLGEGIGSALDLPPAIVPGSAEPIADGTLLTLRVFARSAGRPSFAASLVEVGPDGARRLTPA